MEIVELKAGKGDVNVEGIIVSIGEVKQLDRHGKKLRVVEAILEDLSGKVKLSLWNDDIDKFKVEDRVKVTKGYINEFQGKLQLTAGKFGKLELVKDEEEDVPKPKIRKKKKVIKKEVI